MYTKTKSILLYTKDTIITNTTQLSQTSHAQTEKKYNSNGVKGLMIVTQYTYETEKVLE